MTAVSRAAGPVAAGYLGSERRIAVLLLLKGLLAGGGWNVLETRGVCARSWRGSVAAVL